MATKTTTFNITINNALEIAMSSTMKSSISKNNPHLMENVLVYRYKILTIQFLL